MGNDGLALVFGAHGSVGAMGRDTLQVWMGALRAQKGDSQPQSQVPTYWDPAEDTGATFYLLERHQQVPVATSALVTALQGWNQHHASSRSKTRSILRACGFAAHTELSLQFPPSHCAIHQHHSMISQAVAHPGRAKSCQLLPRAH